METAVLQIGRGGGGGEETIIDPVYPVHYVKRSTYMYMYMYMPYTVHESYY